MNIAITIWGNRISPVFDASKKLLIVRITGSKISDPLIREFEATKFDWSQRVFREQKIKLLICGAICKMRVKRFELIGVEVLPFLTGEVDTFLEYFIKGDDFSNFRMPGCQVSDCCRRYGVTGRHTW